MSLEWAIFIGFWVGCILAMEYFERKQARVYARIRREQEGQRDNSHKALPSEKPRLH